MNMPKPLRSVGLQRAGCSDPMLSCDSSHEAAAGRWYAASRGSTGDDRIGSTVVPHTRHSSASAAVRGCAATPRPARPRPRCRRCPAALPSPRHPTPSTLNVPQQLRSRTGADHRPSKHRTVTMAHGAVLALPCYVAALRQAGRLEAWPSRRARCMPPRAPSPTAVSPALSPSKTRLSTRSKP